MSTKFDFGEFSIVDSALSSTDTTFTIAATKSNRKGQDVAGNAKYYEFPDLTIANFRLEVEEKGGARKETIGIASVADASDDLSDGRKRYTMTMRYYDDASTLMRGIKQNNDGTNAIANQDTSLIVDNFPVGSKVKMVWDAGEQNRLEDLFQAGTTQVDKIAGETIAVRDALSLHTDGKLYKYNSVNYPNAIGIADTAGASGETITYTTFGGLSTGHSGLTIGGIVYAENTGVVTQVSSDTTTQIGIAESATEIRLALAPAVSSQFTDDQFQVQSLTDTTKTLNVDLSGNSTGVDSTFVFSGTADQDITFPDGDFTVPRSADVAPIKTSQYVNAVSGGVSQEDFLYIDSPSTFAKADQDQNFGQISVLNVESSFPVVGNGASMSSMKLALKKAGTPTDNAVIRIETDSAGEPSGTLVDANATANITGGSLTTSFVDTTVTFAGSFTPAAGTKYWVVLTRSGSQDNANYFISGYESRNTYYNYSKFTTSWIAETSRSAYFSAAAGLHTTVLTLTDASNADQIQGTGFATDAAAFGATTTLDISGLPAVFSSLTPGARYFVSDTAGAISTSGGTNAMFVGTAIDANTLEKSKPVPLVVVESSKRTNQDITAEATIIFQQGERNLYGELNTTTGLFTAVKGGYYKFEWSIRCVQTGGADATLALAAKKGGTYGPAVTQELVTTTTDYGLTLSYEDQLLPGDTVSLQAEEIGSGTARVIGNTTSVTSLSTAANRSWMRVALHS